MLSAVAVVITQLPEFSSHGNLVKQFPPGVGFRDPRRLRVWLTLTPWLEGKGGEEHTNVEPQACVGPGTSWAPQRQFISVREDKTAHASVKVRGSCLHGFTPQSSRKFYADFQEAIIYIQTYGSGENFLLHSLPWLSGDTLQMDRREVHTALIRLQLLKTLGNQGRVVQSLS